MERLSRVGAPFARRITFGAAPDGELGVDLDPDPEIPERVELGAAGEDAVDDEDAVARHDRLGRGLVDLGERIDAAQRHCRAGVRSRWFQQQAPCGIEIERVPVVALPTRDRRDGPRATAA